ncbi:MAG: stage II sporulation protein M [Gammaproteobacteria bacterium]
MKQNEFIRRYEPLWETFEKALLIGDSDSLEDLPASYRTICHHLSLAKLRNYSPGLQERLNQIALKGHQYLYAGNNDRATDLSKVFVRDFPRCVRQHKWYVLVSSLLFFGPLIVITLAVINDPAFVYSIIDPETAGTYTSMYSENHQENGRTAVDDVRMFGHYIWNNVSIALRTFASGLLLGVGAIFIILFNGVYIGAVSGLIATSGYGETFWSFVIGHGSFELTAIVLAGATGMKIGFALLLPGRLTRGQSIKQAALDIAPMIYGFVAMLVIAAAIEAFWSPSATIPNNVKFIVGTLLWVFVIGYLTLVGRGGDDNT